MLKTSSGLGRNTDINQQLQSSIDTVLQGSKIPTKGQNEHIAEALFDKTFRNGNVRSILVQKAKTEIRKNWYSDWKVLRAIDNAGGTLNLRGVEILREIETEIK